MLQITAKQEPHGLDLYTVASRSKQVHKWTIQYSIPGESERDRDIYGIADDHDRRPRYHYRVRQIHILKLVEVIRRFSGTES